MKYETPELTALMPAINAIQTVKTTIGPVDNPVIETRDNGMAAYEDWE
ncbi:MAG: hypothetical protein ABSG08_06540 [Terriglobales bacterium]|jgi:hypothetical protein